MATQKNSKAATKAVKVLCNYCQRPARTRIIADHQIYCGKLCAALQFVLDAYEEEKIDDEEGVAGIEPLIDLLFEDRKPIPVKVRDCDIDAAQQYMPRELAEGRPVMIWIEDDGTPDWVPDASHTVVEPSSEEPTQDEVDRVVEKLLTDNDSNEPEGRP